MKKALSQLTIFNYFLVLFLIPTILSAVTLRYWNVGDVYEAIMYRKIAVEFEKETGVKVIVQPVSWGQYYTKYLTAMAAGDPPDLVTATTPGDYGSVGGLIDIQEMFPKEAAELREKIFEGPWKAYYYQGHMYGVPHGMSALALFYRKDIFAQLNIQPPKTWSDLREVMRVLEASEYKYSFAWTRDSFWGLAPYVRAYGKEIFSSSEPLPNWLDPNFRKGFKFGIEIWNNHNIALDKGMDLFVNDEKGIAAPMMMDGLWNYMEFERRAPHLKGKWGVIPMPVPDGGIATSLIGGTSYVIFRKSEHPKEAMQWIMYNYRLETQKFIFKDAMHGRGESKSLYISPLKEFWEEPIPGLPEEDRLALKQILERGMSSEYLIGTSGAGRFLENSTVRIRNALREYLQKVAEKNNTTLFDLHVGFSRGKYRDDYKKFLEYEEQLCDKELERITPIARKDITEKQADFNKYFANITERLPELERKKNILSYAKMFSFAVILCYLGFILLNPRARKYWHSYLYISPLIVSLMVFLLIPMFVSVYIAFTTYNPLLPLSTADWTGLKNFKDVLFAKNEIFTDTLYSDLSFLGKLKLFFNENELWVSLGRSLKYALVVIPLQLIIAIFLAVGLEKNLKPNRLFKFIYFSPLVTSVVSVALIWAVLFMGAKYGWINSFLLSLGIIRDPIEFLRNSNTFLNAVIVMSIWQGLAFVILIYLAGLQNIPRELYEAASIDGANAFQQFRKITVPGLRPQILFLTIIGTIGALQVFEQIYILGGGAGEAGSRFGPADSGMTVVCYLYRKGFEDFQMGQASAIAYVLFAIIFILTYINWKWFLGRKTDET